MTRFVSGTKNASRMSDRDRVAAAAVALAAHEVLGVDDADHVVDALAVHREARQPVEDRDLDHVGHLVVGLHRHHVGAGHHDLAGDGVAEVG